MLKISFEFRKGIFFIRLIGNLNNKNYKTKETLLKNLIIENNFKYIVINTINSSIKFFNLISSTIKSKSNITSFFINNFFTYFTNHLGYPTYIVPLVIMPPIPFEPYLVFSIILIKSMGLFLSEKARLVAIIAGSSAWMLTLLGLLAKLEPAFINSS